MSYSSNFFDQELADALLNKMLGTSLWGVLDITLSKKKYDLMDLTINLRESNYFKEYGFSVTLIDEGNFIQKIPFFENNDEFIEKHNLYFLGKKSYQHYLAFMSRSVKQYNS